MELCKSSKIWASMNTSETGTDIVARLQRTGRVEGGVRLASIYMKVQLRSL